MISARYHDCLVGGRGGGGGGGGEGELKNLLALL